jgi:acetoacetyl-CoA synthetase
MVGAASAATLWHPDAARVYRAHLTRFINHVAARHGIAVPDYASLHRWSIESPVAFWGSLATFCDLRFRHPPDAVLEHGERMPGARFFPGATLNFAENLLRFRDEHPALIWRDETGRRGELSYRELYEQTGRAAAGLRRLGVVAGDRVAAFLPNGPEAVIGMLATTSLGAIWSSCSRISARPGSDRFGQITPRLIAPPATGTRASGSTRGPA